MNSRFLPMAPRWRGGALIVDLGGDTLAHGERPQQTDQTVHRPTPRSDVDASYEERRANVITDRKLHRRTREQFESTARAPLAKRARDGASHAAQHIVVGECDSCAGLTFRHPNCGELPWPSLKSGTNLSVHRYCTAAFFAAALFCRGRSNGCCRHVHNA